MSVKVTGEVWGLVMHSTDKLVLACLADHADKDGIAYPGVQRLAMRTGLTPRSVTATLRRLEAQHVLVVLEIERATRSRRYRLTPELYSPLPLNHVHPEPRSPLNNVPLGVNHVPFTPEPRSPEPSGTIKNRQKRDIAPRASKRCPTAFVLTPTLIAFAVEKGVPAEEVSEQLAAFRDCEFAKAHTDWPATWRTWCRNYRSFNRPPTQQRGGKARRDDVTKNTIANLRRMGDGDDGPEMAGGGVDGRADLVALPGRVG